MHEKEINVGFPLKLSLAMNCYLLRVNVQQYFNKSIYKIQYLQHHFGQYFYLVVFIKEDCLFQTFVTKYNWNIMLNM